MSRLQLRPFSESDLADAGRLLADRHAAQRAAEPLLAARFEDAAEAAAAVADLWAVEGASGAVAHLSGRTVGYLIGSPKATGTWGPNVWVEAAGHAVEDAETARDLYAAAAARWVEEGRSAHYVLVPSTDAGLVDAWFRLGFGQQQVHALREAPPTPLPPSERISIRRARPGDVAALAQLDLALPQHQGLSPVFSSGPVPSLEEALADWEDSIGDEEFAVFVAEEQGQVVGSAVGCSVEKSSTHVGLARPDDAGFLGFAAVLPEARGGGAGRALGEAVLSWITEAGYRTAVTDWRATNLLSSRAWPRLGFRPTFLRLHRMVGH